jgi:hypothetical protein
MVAKAENRLILYELDKTFSFHEFSWDNRDCIGALLLCPFMMKNIKGG